MKPSKTIPTMEEGVTSICILRLSAIGDVTHVIPVVLSLQEQLPKASITWVIGGIEARLVGDLPGVEFMIFDKTSGWRGYKDLYGLMKNRKFDVLFHMQVAFRANLVAAMIPAKLKVGYDKARSKDLHGLVINRRIAAASRQHVRDCLASFPEAIGLQAARPIWHIPTSDDDRAFAARYLDPHRLNVIVSPCASHALRNWPADRYAKLADYAVRRHDMNVILVGSPAPSEMAYCKNIASAMRESSINLCGQDTLKQLTALLGHAELLIAPDTGPAHIASAVGTDVIGLYAASNPHRSGPYGSLRWCVDRYPQALQKYTGKTVRNARWGTRVEYPGAMEMIEVADVCQKLDEWVAYHRCSKAVSNP